MSLAVLVHGCDRYRLLFEGQQAFFNKYWDYQLPEARYYLGLETIDLEFPRFQTLHSGAGEWSDRLRALLEQISEPYVLYMQEDMWPVAPIQAPFFTELLSFALREQAPLIKLHSSNVYQTHPTGDAIQGLAVTLLDNDKSDYLMSHQITLWKREFLLEQLPKGEHPWRNERRGTKRLKKLSPRIFHLDYFAENGHPEINANHKEALRSAYATVSYNACFNDAAVPLIQELLKDPAHRDYALRCETHIQKGLTHDGRPRPHKEDVIKKLKKRLRNWLS